MYQKYFSPLPWTGSVQLIHCVEEVWRNIAKILAIHVEVDMLCAAHVDIQREEPGVSQHEDPLFAEYRNKALPAKEI